MSKALVKSTYTTLVVTLFLKDIVQSLTDSKRFVSVDLRVINPCWERVDTTPVLGCCLLISYIVNVPSYSAFISEQNSVFGCTIC